MKREASVDVWLGAVMVLIGSGWSWQASELLWAPGTTIPSGPGVFPFSLGLLLAFLGLLLITTAMNREKMSDPSANDGAIADGEPAPARRLEAAVVASTVLLFFGYAFLLDKIGFLLATPVAVIAALYLVVGVRSWLRILSMAAALTAGSYILFGVLLGTYLPRGAWIQLI